MKTTKFFSELECPPVLFISLSIESVPAIQMQLELVARGNGTFPELTVRVSGLTVRVR